MNTRELYESADVKPSVVSGSNQRRLYLPSLTVAIWVRPEKYQARLYSAPVAIIASTTDKQYRGGKRIHRKALLSHLHMSQLHFFQVVDTDAASFVSASHL